MERYTKKRISILLLAVIAVIAVIAVVVYTTGPEERTSATRANVEATEATETEPNQFDGIEREDQRLKDLATPDLRAEIDSRIERLRNLREDKTKEADKEEKAEFIYDLTFSLAQAFWALDDRDEMTPRDEVARLRFVEIPGDTEDLKYVRAQREQYLREDYDPDNAASRDLLAVLEANIKIRKAYLARNEAELRIAERRAKTDETPEEAEGLSL